MMGVVFTRVLSFSSSLHGVITHDSSTDSVNLFLVFNWRRRYNTTVNVD